MKAALQRTLSFTGQVAVRLANYWARDIQRRQGCRGKALSIIVGLFLILFACACPVAVFQMAGEAIGLLPTRTATPVPTATSTPVPTDTPEPTNTPGPTDTLSPTAPVSPTTTETPTNVPTPTSITPPTASVATSTPPPTSAPSGSDNPTFSGDVVDPSWWPCQQGQIKANRNSGIYHVPGGAFYARTYENVECFNTEANAQAAGYRRAQR
jgi:hypothetical protein